MSEGQSAERRRREDERGRRFSFAGRLMAGYLALLVVISAVAILAGRLPLSEWGAFLAVLLVAVPLGAWWIGRMTRPLERVVQGVADGIRSFRDQDFGVRLAYRRNDELGELVDLYNEVGEILQDERRSVRQRELLLQSALDRSPAAIVLVNQLDRVVYSNREARRLLLGGAKLEGNSFSRIRAGCPPEMGEILDNEAGGIFSVRSEDRVETYHLSQRRFRLNRRSHLLIVLRRMTGDLGRQEAETWKRVIRVISHELNNSLAPVSSLVHSAHKVSGDPRHTERSEEIFTSIRERLNHLQRFIEGYARFARLPKPRREAVDWRELLDGLAEYPTLTVTGRLPSRPGYFDPAQMQQVLINLVKNAIEASDGEPEVSVRIKTTEDGTFLQVTDRGRGMDDETMKSALLPFYSTKQTGSGLGLPLCREILEAHGGKLSLQSNSDGGTTVTCWLPPAPAAVDQAAGG